MTDKKITIKGYNGNFYHIFEKNTATYKGRR